MLGMDEGLANGQPSTGKRLFQLVVGDHGTERLMIVVNLSWLTVKGMAAGDDERRKRRGCEAS